MLGLGNVSGGLLRIEARRVAESRAMNAGAADWETDRAGGRRIGAAGEGLCFCGVCTLPVRAHGAGSTRVCVCGACMLTIRVAIGWYYPGFVGLAARQVTEVVCLAACLAKPSGVCWSLDINSVRPQGVGGHATCETLAVRNNMSSEFDLPCHVGALIPLTRKMCTRREKVTGIKVAHAQFTHLLQWARA